VRRLLRALPLRACPVCDARFARFAPSHRGERSACPRCGSLQRHRLAWLYLRPRLPAAGRVLHLAPEEGLRRRLAALPGIEHVGADLEPRPGDLAIDLTATGLADASFDVVLCIHVLEHIPDDRAALREIARVLRPGGWALVQVPLLRERTDEDPAVTDPAQRLARFGQVDHVRVYGYDFLDRVHEAGLRVTVVDMRALLGRWTRWRCGLGYADRALDRLPAAWEVYRADRAAAADGAA
jgi:SAM-dependent methyltransferase